MAGLPEISQGPYLVLEAAQAVLRAGLDAALTEIEGERGALGFTLERPADHLIEQGDIRGSIPQGYPTIRLVLQRGDFGQTDAPVGLEDLLVKLLVRIYVQNDEAGAAETSTMSVLLRKTGLYTDAVRRVIERDLTPANGATGVYAVEAGDVRFVEPRANASKRRRAVHTSELTFRVLQRTRRSQHLP